MAEKSRFEQLRQDERETRRAIIVEAAMELFSTKAFAEIGMRDIAMAAGISPASIYRYFPSRDDLFVEALTLDLGRVKALLEKRLTDGRDSIEEFALAVVDYLIDNEAIFQIMSHFMIRGQLNAKTLERFNAVARQFLGLFDAVLTRAGLSGTDRLFTHAFFAALAGVLMTYRNYPGRSADEKREHIHRLALLIARKFKISD